MLTSPTYCVMSIHLFGEAVTQIRQMVHLFGEAVTHIDETCDSPVWSTEWSYR